MKKMKGFWALMALMLAVMMVFSSLTVFAEGEEPQEAGGKTPQVQGEEELVEEEEEPAEGGEKPAGPVEGGEEPAGPAEGGEEPAAPAAPQPAPEGAEGAGPGPAEAQEKALTLAGAAPAEGEESPRGSLNGTTGGNTDPIGDVKIENIASATNLGGGFRVPWMGIQIFHLR